jgi:hypothetical protein
MPVPSKSAPPGFEFDTSKRVDIIERDAGTPKPASPKPLQAETWAESSTKEITKLLSKLRSAKPLKDLEPTPNSRSAKALYCMNTNVPKALKHFVRFFERAKWEQSKTHASPKNTERQSFAAHTTRFRVHGTISQGNYKDCEKTDNQTRIELRFVERPQVPGEAGPQKLPSKNAGDFLKAPPQLRPELEGRALGISPSKSASNPTTTNKVAN